MNGSGFFAAYPICQDGEILRKPAVVTGLSPDNNKNPILNYNAMKNIPVKSIKSAEAKRNISESFKIRTVTAKECSGLAIKASAYQMNQRFIDSVLLPLRK